MKPKHILLPAGLLFFVFAKGQKIVDSTITKSVTDQKTDAVKDINDNLTEKRKKLIDDVFHFSFGKKKGDGKSGGAAETFQPGPGKTLISIAGTDYASLSGFSDVLEANTQVTKVDSEFSDGTGTLKVCHSGTVKELLGDLAKKTSGRLVVTNEKDGVVSMKAQ